jgi:enoyl-CoA hydratase
MTIDGTRLQASATGGDQTQDRGVLTDRVGATVALTLSRPAQLNAVTTAMRTTIAAALAKAARDPEVYAVILKAADAVTAKGHRVFCAGGDIRELADMAQHDMAAARQSLAAEYALNWQLECFSKPHVALIDGLVVGSGVGLSLYGTHRVAGPGYRFAMPETAIGLFPDDGVTHTFARMPGEIGAFLALTGQQIRRADALALGLVTHCVPSAAFADIAARLAQAEPVDRILDGLHITPGVATLDAIRPVIDRCFAGNSVPAILSRLKQETGAHKVWAQTVLADLETRSPLALVVTLRHLRAVASMDLRQTLMVDYRLALSCIATPDFREGVRASLIDKDHRPRWQPNLPDVSPAIVERMFEARPDAVLALPTRRDMQAARP